MKYGILCFAVALVALASGCVSYDYEGKKGTASAVAVQVYSSPDAIRKPYSVLGTATASGNSESISRDRLVEKLVKEAGKTGADAILIVEQQVVPDGTYSSSNRRYMNESNEESNFQEICRDMDTTYGNMRNRSQMETKVVSYRRIIRAEYLQYLPGEAKPVPPPAKAVAVKPAEKSAESVTKYAPDDKKIEARAATAVEHLEPASDPEAKNTVEKTVEKAAGPVMKAALKTMIQK